MVMGRLHLINEPMKIALTVMLILGLTTGGYFVWKKAPALKPAQSASSKQATAEVEIRDIYFAVNAAGDIGPADQVSVRPEVNGIIAELPVDIGDKVTQGQLLCRLDDKDLQIERTTRMAEIDGSRLQMERATRNFERAKRMANEKLISTEAYEDARTDYELSTNSLARSISALRQVEDRIRKTKIIAPFDCTILTRPVSIGQAVSGSGGYNSGTEVMSIANLNDMIITAHINQADVIRLNVGQAVDVQVESIPGLKLEGKLERLAPQAVIRNGIKGFTARIKLKEVDARVRPGMTALLRIPVGEAEDVLTIPLAAIYTDTLKGERYVYIKGKEKFERQIVRVGLTDNFYAEVQEGLVEGDLVALGEILEQNAPANVAGTRPGKKTSLAGKTASGTTSNSTGTVLTPRPATSRPAGS
jgi:HlyD family secretion protein